MVARTLQLTSMQLQDNVPRFYLEVKEKDTYITPQTFLNGGRYKHKAVVFFFIYLFFFGGGAELVDL